MKNIAELELRRQKNDAIRNDIKAGVDPRAVGDPPFVPMQGFRPSRVIPKDLDAIAKLYGNPIMKLIEVK